MSLNHYLTTRYGTSLKLSSNRLKRICLQIAKTKNRVLFLERCRHHKIIPRSLNVKCPIKTPRAQRLTKKYSFDLLRETLRKARGDLNQRQKEKEKICDKIKNKVSSEDFQKISSVVEKRRERTLPKKEPKTASKIRSPFGEKWQP